jgi:IS30 family transposase
VARTQDVWGAEGISGRVKFLLLAWAGMPKTSFRKNSDSPQRLQMSYKHLCPEERHYIEIELKKGASQNKIAESLGRSQSSISRELGRNTGQRGYRNKQAESLARERHKNKPKQVKLTDEIKCIINTHAGSRYFCESLFWASQPKQAAKT